MSVTHVLFHFACSCGYQEDVGIGIHVGIIIKGEVTFICPKCGNIVYIPNNVVLMKPVLINVKA